MNTSSNYASLKRKVVQNGVSVLVLLAVGLCWLVLIGGLPDRRMSARDTGILFFPQVLNYMLFALTGVLAAQTALQYRRLRKLSQPTDQKGHDANARTILKNATFYLVGFLVASVFYVGWLLPILGFIPSTTLYLLANCFFFGARRPVAIVLYSTSVSVVLYGFFRVALNIPLP